MNLVDAKIITKLLMFLWCYEIRSLGYFKNDLRCWLFPAFSLFILRYSFKHSLELEHNWDIKCKLNKQHSLSPLSSFPLGMYSFRGSSFPVNVIRNQKLFYVLSVTSRWCKILNFHEQFQTKERFWIPTCYTISFLSDSPLQNIFSLVFRLVFFYAPPSDLILILILSNSQIHHR